MSVDWAKYPNVYGLYTSQDSTFPRWLYPVDAGNSNVSLPCWIMKGIEVVIERNGDGFSLAGNTSEDDEIVKSWGHRSTDIEHLFVILRLHGNTI